MTFDFRSDTLTRPTDAMRNAMAKAEVGDDVYGEDPSINRLQDMVASIFDAEAALYVPSGTMANQIAIKIYTTPGSTVITGEDAHTFLFESGGPGLISGVLQKPCGSGGLFNAQQLASSWPGADYHYSRAALVCVENTHNKSGGRVFPHADIAALAAEAHERSVPLHLDGARIFNAIVATAIEAKEWYRVVDSLSFCLSKGLGAPVGSVMVGDRHFIKEAWRLRKMLGGGMRQAGILAAAGIHALDHHVERLAEDHANAQAFAAGVAQIDGLDIPHEPETNIVVFRTDADYATEFVETCDAEGVRMIALGPDTIRAVTHLHIQSGDIDAAINRVASVTKRFRNPL